MRCTHGVKPEGIREYDYGKGSDANVLRTQSYTPIAPGLGFERLFPGRYVHWTYHGKNRVIANKTTRHNGEECEDTPCRKWVPIGCIVDLPTLHNALPL